MSNEEQFTLDCLRKVARIALANAANLSTSESVMIHRGIAAMFPKGNPEHEVALNTANTLEQAEQNQLKLTQLLDN